MADYEYTKEEQEEAGRKNVNIRVQTLMQMLIIIDAAHKRGLFKASEMSFVGNIYDTINERVEKALLTVRTGQNGTNGMNRSRSVESTNGMINDSNNTSDFSRTNDPENSLERQMQEREKELKQIPNPTVQIPSIPDNYQGYNQPPNQNQFQQGGQQMPTYQPPTVPTAPPMPKALQPEQTRKVQSQIQEPPKYQDIAGHPPRMG